MDVALLDSGGVLVSDSENSVVRHISPDSIVTTVTGDSTGQEAMLYRPQGITVTPNGDILICDTLNHRIARLRPESGVVSTLAQAKRWEQEPQLGASFGMPTSVAQLPSGNFIVSAGATNRSVGTAAHIHAVSVCSSFCFAVHHVDVFWSAIKYDLTRCPACMRVCRLWEVTSEGSITKVVGDGPGFIDDVCGHFQDGPGSTAKFWHPCGICVDGVGNVVVADTNNNCIRLVRPSQGWTCTKIAGDLRRGHRDGDAEHAQFFRPVGLTLDRDGSILVADTDNHVVRRVRATSYDFTI
jgi:DNA-binding beta-propeller fold protein YncE